VDGKLPTAKLAATTSWTQPTRATSDHEDLGQIGFLSH